MKKMIACFSRPEKWRIPVAKLNNFFFIIIGKLQVHNVLTCTGSFQNREPGCSSFSTFTAKPGSHKLFMGVSKMSTGNTPTLPRASGGSCSAFPLICSRISQNHHIDLFFLPVTDGELRSGQATSRAEATGLGPKRVPGSASGHHTPCSGHQARDGAPQAP